MASRQSPTAVILLALVFLSSSIEGWSSRGPCSYKKCQKDEGCFVRNKVALCVKRKCLLPKDPGPCKKFIPRFYFNKVKGHCEPFYWGQCGGNANRFTNLIRCEKECGQPRVYGDCVKPADTGSCNKKIPMFYYNPVNRRCEKFHYGGCLNSNNRFRTLKLCQAYCAPKDYGVNKNCANKKTKCGKWAAAGECEKNPWFMLFKCPKACKQCFLRYVKQHQCSYRPQKGPCNLTFRRFYYDGKTGKCHPFTYGGCRGNINSFASVDACKKACAPRTTPPGAALPCKDKNKLCRFWAGVGKCRKNPGWMLAHCRISCNMCRPW